MKFSYRDNTIFTRGGPRFERPITAVEGSFSPALSHQRLAAIVPAWHLAGMTKPNPHICEVKVGSVWCAMSLDEAATHHVLAVKRCPACHGRVAINGTYNGPNVLRRLYHRKAHSGCPLKPETYSGTPSPHPQAMI
jgi:hypothetical protein